MDRYARDNPNKPWDDPIYAQPRFRPRRWRLRLFGFVIEIAIRRHH